MYDLKAIALYSFIFLAVVLTLFPDKLQQVAPENQYLRKLIEYKQPVALVSIAGSIYIYLTSPELQFKSSSGSDDSDAVTISSPLPTETPSTRSSSRSSSKASIKNE